VDKGAKGFGINCAIAIKSSATLYSAGVAVSVGVAVMLAGLLPDAQLTNHGQPPLQLDQRCQPRGYSRAVKNAGTFAHDSAASLSLNNERSIHTGIYQQLFTVTNMPREPRA